MLSGRHGLEPALDTRQRQPHGGERVLDLVRDLAGRAAPRRLALRPRQAFTRAGEALGHGVERRAQAAQLARAGRAHPGLEVALGDTLEGGREVAQGAGGATRDHGRCQERESEHRQHQRRHEQPDEAALDVHQNAEPPVMRQAFADALDLLEEVGRDQQADEHRAVRVGGRWTGRSGGDARHRRQRAAWRVEHA
jgi:hypothetical protein